jgi:hypothetical protein
MTTSARARARRSVFRQDRRAAKRQNKIGSGHRRGRSREFSKRATRERVSAPLKTMSAVEDPVAVGGPAPVLVVGSVLSSLTWRLVENAWLAALSAHVPPDV